MTISWLKLHSYNSAIALVITLIALVLLVRGLRRKQAYGKLTERVMLAFSLVMALQWLVGIAALITKGIYDNDSFWRHIATMTVATVIAFLPRSWRVSNSATRYRRDLIVVITVIVLVSVGVAFLIVNWRKKL